MCSSCGMELPEVSKDKVAPKFIKQKLSVQEEAGAVSMRKSTIRED